MKPIDEIKISFKGDSTEVYLKFNDKELFSREIWGLMSIPSLQEINTNKDAAVTMRMNFIDAYKTVETAMAINLGDKVYMDKLLQLIQYNNRRRIY